MFRKTLVATATAALILSGTSAVASAQSAAPYPSSQIPVHPSWVSAVQQVIPVSGDVVTAGIQIGGAWVLSSLASSVSSNALRSS